ncbi:hypothetical protein FKG94_16900 [Exilibacterium tricleocarpae]|uniref:Uncharacterized protein n=1 Tax=Exilibacterium tricleocarpae TaxID=2591008 RepID=A0A545T829_9GAMM|nr:hypothetical protein [Exilibacterium tricleocarpae]TQV73384.1 hypothetical protein FKG94_16900 [Exilibacterium tricleocarpae]
MNKYYLDLRHRAKVDEPIQNKHKHFMQTMAEIEAPWGYGGKSVPAVNVSDMELVAVVELGELSSRGIKSYITYKLRSEKYLRDNAQYDDTVIIEFKPGDADLSNFIETVFPRYIEAFDCYRATVGNREIAQDDWGTIVEQCNSQGRDVNGRDGVYRINELNFYDRELCKRAFGLSPEAIVKRLEGKVERVSLFHDGVLLVGSSTLLSRDELEKLNSTVKALLK